MTARQTILKESIGTMREECLRTVPTEHTRTVLLKILELVQFAYDAGWKDCVGSEAEAIKPPRSGNSSEEK